MIVYMCKRTNGNLTMKRWVKMRTSDKNKRWHDNFHKRRGQHYWWKDVE